ncbi:MAG: transglutaminase-like domain-containing protein [Planctomycetes bacterium]|nr:transglutaminase-like domain-containing protein [Planctomycetota bacterium]
MKQFLTALVLGLAIFGNRAPAEDLKWDAKTLFEKSITQDLRLDGPAIVLEEGELFEDDGPAAGFTYKPNEEKLSDKIWIKKELLIPNPAARKAMLLVAAGGDLKGSINGKSVELKTPAKTGQNWQAYDISPNLLKTGKNEIVLSGNGKVWIARDEDFAKGSTTRTKHPNRSARSTDAGKTWDYDHLGPNGDIDGEYYVRLFLTHHRSSGTLTLPVLDSGNLNGQPIAPPLAKPVKVRVHLDSERAEAGLVRLHARTGTTPIPDSKTWSNWYNRPARDLLANPKGRYFQIRIELATIGPLFSSAIRGLHIETDAAKNDAWSQKLKVTEFQNAEIVRSSVPFAYEPFDQLRLKELRKGHGLDEVVKGAKTELEMIEKLARWSSGCWEKGHLGTIYPEWDALEILKLHSDGKPIGGFCQHYNLCLLQACESFGIPGRAVSISKGDHGEIKGSGHEVIELWSNQFKKWIYVDGNMAWYAVDDKTGVPLSLMELRQRQWKTVDREPVEKTRFVELIDGKQHWTSLTEWPSFQELRLIPRSNFLEEKAPLPLHQGMRGWFWTGHAVFTDDRRPAGLIYGQRISDRRNWDWTLNQARITLEATATENELRVHLETQTPGFATFLANIDGAGLKPVETGFIWKLKAGNNRLEVHPRNTAGRDGIVSRVVIDRP